MALAPGSHFGPYEALELVGAGGMGEVYRARDTRLRRDVALKRLPGPVAGDAERRARVELEARAIAALDHPNIVTIYSVEESEGVPFFTMQYVEGRTLGDLIPTRGLPLSELLKLAVPLTDAIAAAHQRGILHRDLKPANVMVTAEGRVKVLDFGLAKLKESGAPTDETMATGDMTVEGRILGTVAYMSPEQAQGKAVDARSDVFSLGVVLYQMATGQPPFQGDTNVSVLSAILKDTPTSVSSLRPDLPDLARVIAKALSKDPGRRHQTAADLRADLEAIKADLDSGELQRARARALPARLVRAWWKWAAAAGLVAVAALAGFWALRPRPLLAATDTLLLADVVNRTGDPVFDSTVKQALAVKLGESPFLSLVSENRAAETLKLMKRPANAALTGEVAREVCQRVGAKALVEGDITALGSSYVIGLNTVGCEDGAVLARTQLQAPRKEEVLQAVDRGTAGLRERLGESLPSIRIRDTSLAQVTTGSLEAWKAYSDALETVSRRGDFDAAIALLEHALELDPDFAMAHARLGMFYANVPNGRPRALAHRERAFALKDRLTERERLYITGLSFAGKDMERALEAWETYGRRYPRDPVPRNNAGSMYYQLGQIERGVERFREAYAIDPTPFYGTNLAVAYLAAGRLEEAKTLAEKVIAGGYRETQLLMLPPSVAFIRGDTNAFETMAVPAAAGSELPWRLARAEAAMSSGKAAAGRRLFEQAAAAATRLNNPLTAEAAMDLDAFWEAQLGDARRVAERRQRARGLAGDSPGHVIGVFVLTAAGDRDGSRELVERLRRNVPPGPLAQRLVMPLLQAMVSFLDGRPAEAIAQLEATAPYEYVPISLQWLGGFGLAACDLRGRSFLAIGEGAKAAVEFQKILDHAGVEPLVPACALAPLNLARAWTLAGDTGRAREAYRRFLDRWKDADADVPVLAAAKAEYARLK